MSVLNSAKPHWSLTRMDRLGWPSVSIEGQFRLPDGITWNVGTNWASIPTLNSDGPFLQWINGDLQTITFDALLFADPALMGANASSDQVMAKFRKFLSLIERDKVLRRPPVCKFVYGDVFGDAKNPSMDVVVQSLGGIQIGALTGGKLLGFETEFGSGGSIVKNGTGQVRSIGLSITLAKYKSIKIQDTDPAFVPGRSRHHIAKTGDSYESIAKEEYGDAIWGDRLRKQHLDRPIIKEGDVVRVPRSRIITNEVVEPSCSVLKRETEALDALRTIEITRAKAINTFIFP